MRSNGSARVEETADCPAKTELSSQCRIFLRIVRHIPWADLSNPVKIDGCGCYDSSPVAVFSFGTVFS